MKCRMSRARLITCLHAMETTSKEEEEEMRFVRFSTSLASLSSSQEMCLPGFACDQPLCLTGDYSAGPCDCTTPRASDQHASRYVAAARRSKVHPRLLPNCKMRVCSRVRTRVCMCVCVLLLKYMGKYYGSCNDDCMHALPLWMW